MLRKSLPQAVTYEVYADGGDVGLCVGVVGEPQQQARLAYTGITDEEQLEEVVVSSISSAAAAAGRPANPAGVAKVGGGSAEENPESGQECQQQTKTGVRDGGHRVGFQREHTTRGSSWLMRDALNMQWSLGWAVVVDESRENADRQRAVGRLMMWKAAGRSAR